MLSKISIIQGAFYYAHPKVTTTNLCALQLLLACGGNHGMCGEIFFFLCVLHYTLKQFNEQQQSALEDYVETALIVRYNRDK